MRRSQNNAGSQPVRNLATAPSFETTGANVVVQTNHAPNPRGVTALAGYGTQTVSTVTGLGSNPDGITTANRVSYSAGNANPGILFMANPDVNTLYSFSAWVYNEGPSESIALAQQSVASGGSQTVPQAVWTKLTWLAYTTHATTAFGIGVRIASPANNGSFLVTGFMAEKVATPLGVFFDGAKASAGDYTYGWVGAANASASEQRALSVVGALGGSGQAVAHSSIDRPAHGTRFARWFFLTNLSIGININDCIIPANVSRTVGMWVRPSHAVNVIGRLRTPGGATFTILNSTALTAGVWQKLVVSVQNPVIGADASFGLLISSNNGQVYGGTLDVDSHWCYDEIDDLDYIDGNIPFAKWNGTAHASSSVGYPPQLLDIAGQPAVDITGVGTTGGVPIPVSPFGARTFYVVYESTGFTQAFQNCFRYGITASKGFMLQTAGAGSSSLNNRIDFPGGTSNGSIVLGSGRVARRHVAAFSFAEGLASSSSCLNGATDQVVNPNPGTGWDDGRVETSAASEIKAIRALVFYAEHDRATRLAISRYLGNKYGASVA